MKKRLLSFIAVLVLITTVSVMLPVSASAAVCNPGCTEFAPFTFTDSNMGAYHTINGTKMRYCIAFKSTDANSCANLYTACYEYGGKRMEHFYSYYNPNSLDENGYMFVQSDWFDVVYGVDYRLYYEAIPFWDDSHLYPIHVYCWIEVQ